MGTENSRSSKIINVLLFFIASVFVIIAIVYFVSKENKLEADKKANAERAKAKFENDKKASIEKVEAIKKKFSESLNDEFKNYKAKQRNVKEGVLSPNFDSKKYYEAQYLDQIDPKNTIFSNDLPKENRDYDSITKLWDINHDRLLSLKRKRIEKYESEVLPAARNTFLEMFEFQAMVENGTITLDSIFKHIEIIKTKLNALVKEGSVMVNDLHDSSISVLNNYKKVLNDFYALKNLKRSGKIPTDKEINDLHALFTGDFQRDYIANIPNISEEYFLPYYEVSENLDRMIREYKNKTFEDGEAWNPQTWLARYKKLTFDLGNRKPILVKNLK